MTILARFAVAACCLAACCLVLTARPAPAQPPSLPEERFRIRPADRVDLLLFKDPSFYKRLFKIQISDEPIELWGQALRRGESVLTQLTADTISLALDRGMSGLEILVADLADQLNDDSLTTAARRAVIRALTKLDAREHAVAIVSLAGSNGTLFEDLADQAMIQWELDLMADRWQERLTAPGIPRRSRILALQGCAAIGLRDAADSIETLATDRRQPAEVRLAAGEALGDLFDSGLSGKAAALIDSDDSNRVDQQVAIAMLRRHSGPDTIDVLKKLTNRESTATQFGAFQILYEIDQSSLLNVLDQFVDSPDANVRRIFADAIMRNHDPKQVPYLAKFLNDVNPSLRMRVADGLVRLALNDPEYKAEVISQLTAVLDNDAWRGCEQAAIVLINLGYTDCSDRLVDLMRHGRDEVMTTAGWGLRRFALRKHLPAMLGRAQEIYEQSGPQRLMAQLMMSFGKMRYREAEPLIRKYLPRNFELGERPRASAVWAIGFFYDEPPEDLVTVLTARLNDVRSAPPEYEDVRTMSALTLGRIGAKSALPDLRRYADDRGSFTAQACHWAIEKLTGTPAPDPLPPFPIDYDDWFLRRIE